ncbi:restriction endonuclease subunit S [Microcoleus sp. Pol11C3]|uniref:restriction endonuclease subunit S n=1 Tax=Microcoleus sp. Pol11C3 TaxID=3055390 RepID=UPI002FD10C18
MLKKLGEVADFTNGGAWTPDEYVESGIPVVRVSDIQNETINLQQCKYLLPESISKYKKHTLFQGDLVIATVGSHPTQPGSVVGRPGIVPQYVQGALLNQNAVRIAPANNYLDKKYLAYLGKSQFFRNYIIRHARGSANQVRMSIGLLKEMEVLLPPLPIQRKIAAILSAYDRLIENNTRRIEILEEMARSIYREWFVKFRFPGHEQVQMVDSELGLIPEGWEVAKLGDVSCVIPGYAFKSKDWQKTGIPVIKIKNINANNTVDIQQTDFVSQSILTPKLKKYLLKGGEFLIAMTGATAGKVGKLRTKEPMLLNQRVAKIEPLYNYRSYIWQIISSEEGQNRFFKLADGAAQPNMSGLQIEEVRIILPFLSLCTDFDSIVNDIYRQIDNFIFRNQILRETRDLLLPRLISGEIDVENLDINTGEIAA